MNLADIFITFRNTNLGTPEAPLERPPSASQPAAPKSKRKPQDERSRASNNGKTGWSVVLRQSGFLRSVYGFLSGKFDIFRAV